MAQGQNNNQVLVPQAKAGLNNLKFETATELGINIQPGQYLGDYTSKQMGAIGGNMVRKMIALAEQQLSGK